MFRERGDETAIKKTTNPKAVDKSVINKAVKAQCHKEGYESEINKTARIKYYSEID